MKLETLFQKSADIVGPCPLPDPQTGGMKTIYHPSLVRVEKQPVHYDYDRADNKAEARRFQKRISKMVSTGQITQTEADRLLAIG